MKKQKIRFSEVVLPLDIEHLEDGSYLATSKKLNGLIAQGRTLAETLEIAQDVARKLIESCVEHDDPLPSFIRKQMSKQSRSSHLQIPVMVPA